MSNWRNLARDLVPPLLLRALRGPDRTRIRFTGRYAAWPDAVAASRGYGSETIFEKTRNAALKVAAGEAAYERDSVVFDRVEYAFPVIAALLRCACANDGRLHVLDFGGSLGTSYRQFKSFRAPLHDLRWSVVEQARYVACGREHFENEELRFFDSVSDAAARRGTPHAVLFSGVLQYLEDPDHVIGEVGALSPAMIVVDRTYCAASAEDVLAVQIVPPHIYDASYPCWIFSRSRLLRAFGDMFRLVASFNDTSHSWSGPDGRFDLAGFIMERRP